MPNTAAICTSFKSEVLTAQHNLNSHTLRMALYLASATYNASTTVYSTTGEVSGTGYTAGGATVTNGTVTTSGTTAFWTPSANVTWTTVTLSTAFDAALLYNTSSSNRAIAVFTFSSQTVTAGNFTLTMPTNDATNALIRLN